MSKKVPFVDEVEIFNSTFGKPNNYEPTVPADTKLTNFVVDFIKEETEELAEAIENGDIVEVLDAICDLLYVAVGNAAMVFGVKDKLMDAYAEVQASNMSKSCETEEEARQTVAVRSAQHGPCHYNKVGDRWVVYRTSDDKVMKSINYFAPDLKQFFTEEEIQKAYDDRTGKN
jgi:phosphoribosyl-ATP pyrophosphohydrolase